MPAARSGRELVSARRCCIARDGALADDRGLQLGGGAGEREALLLPEMAQR